MSTYSLNDVCDRDELEATGSATIKAHEQGHDLGNWRPIGERMRVAGCRRCSQLVWIVRPLPEETWRVGGNALKADCERGFENR